jgi:4-carboxymuconolactone decarboxylase
MKLFATTLAMLSLAASAEAEQRKPAPRVAPADVRAVAPALAGYTDEVLFADLWARPDLAPRDRSIVTVAALVAGGPGRAAGLPPEPGDGQRLDPGPVV